MWNCSPVRLSFYQSQPRIRCNQTVHVQKYCGCIIQHDQNWSFLLLKFPFNPNSLMYIAGYPFWLNDKSNAYLDVIVEHHREVRKQLLGCQSGLKTLHDIKTFEQLFHILHTGCTLTKWIGLDEGFGYESGSMTSNGYNIMAQGTSTELTISWIKDKISHSSH